MKRGIIYFISVVVLFSLVKDGPAQESSFDDCVSCWANRLGHELWNLGKIITKSSEIRSRYSFLNAQIEKKNPRLLLAEIIENVARMMDRKMDAVKCIVEKAEEVAAAFEFNETTADEYTYYNSKYSYVEGVEGEEYTEESEKYYNITIDTDDHFYDLPVNTNYSSVHVPTNVFDREQNALFAIQWSEELDEVFIKNYNSDPSLSWQYFASSSGIMRHYPAMKWTVPFDKDEFDARIRTWFIEASTCTKDVIILLDNSGSMAGMRNHIAKFAVHSILDTFSNNDYINVLNYSTHINYTVPCFKDMLVQATKENILVFKSAIEFLKPNDKSNVGNALNHSLALLRKYRENRGCEFDTTACNQAIMVITDGVTEKFNELFEQFNSINNNGNRTIPVRIFTYLVGKEVSHVEEIKEMACANRGFFSHVESLEQVSASVFNYVMVIARPLVLQAVDHPASWTHAYPDPTAKIDVDDKKSEPYRLLTSVAVPAFDTKINKRNGTREAQLLGVAGTDVPIDDIGKLTLPYKIGVNGYAFVVSNNGYVLMHPDLRPLYEGKLKENSNSVDFTEVEQHYGQERPREISPLLEELRKKLVMGVEGSMHNVLLKYHFDDNRRISKESYDYYFAPLNSTPFSIGIAVPSVYGKYQIDVGDQIQKNKHTGIKIESYFDGDNWKVHPKWVYCRYHYLEGHEFDTPENELLHFLKKMRTLYRGFEWRRQYEAMIKVEGDGAFEKEDLDEVQCGRDVLGREDYYCDKQLVNRLIFDATSTYEAFKESWKFKDEIEKEIFSRYNATLRFVATTSGLTRWEYIYGDIDDNETKEFGDWHSRAINENWYKSAIIHHQSNRHGFTYAVPFGTAPDQPVSVTGSYAIFHQDMGQEAPAAVVGFQFSHELLTNRFYKITMGSDGRCSHCPPCWGGGGEESLDCFIVDEHGYILVSYDDKHIGKFFGNKESAVFNSMLTRGIFERMTIFDFQGVCTNNGSLSSDGNFLSTPFKFIEWAWKVTVSKLVWLFLEVNWHNLWNPEWVYAEEEEDDDEDEGLRSCDKKRVLYVVNQSIFSPGTVYYQFKENGRIPSYSVKNIPYSNLLLVAVKNTESKQHVDFNVEMEEIIYENVTYPCQKLNLNNLTRRRLSGCYNEDPLENEIKACGRSPRFTTNKALIFILIFAFKYLCS